MIFLVVLRTIGTLEQGRLMLSMKHTDVRTSQVACGKQHLVLLPHVLLCYLFKYMAEDQQTSKQEKYLFVINIISHTGPEQRRKYANKSKRCSRKKRMKSLKLQRNLTLHCSEMKGAMNENSRWPLRIEQYLFSPNQHPTKKEDLGNIQAHRKHFCQQSEWLRNLISLVPPKGANSFQTFLDAKKRSMGKTRYKLTVLFCPKHTRDRVSVWPYLSQSSLCKPG